MINWAFQNSLMNSKQWLYEYKMWYKNVYKPSIAKKEFNMELKINNVPNRSND